MTKAKKTTAKNAVAKRTTNQRQDNKTKRSESTKKSTESAVKSTSERKGTQLVTHDDIAYYFIEQKCLWTPECKNSNAAQYMLRWWRGDRNSTSYR